MFIHQLTITPQEAHDLQEHHRILIEKLNKGKSLQWDYIAGLVQDMKAIFRKQSGLHSFWHQVQRDQEKHHYLHLTHDNKEILNLPWQMAIDADEYPFVYISKGFPKQLLNDQHPAQAKPLKVLIMISSPDDLGTTHRLSYEMEEDAIMKSLAPLWEAGQLQVDFTDYGSLQNLQEKLQQQQYHILYVSGHGTYRNNTGYLLLENQDTLQCEYVPAGDFASTVVRNPAHIPALVVLASCQTAQGNNEDGFTGVADELMRAGIPAVIAMAFSIRDDFATVFAGQLFERLAKRDTLPVAYGESLKVMREKEQRGLKNSGQYVSAAQWLVPQLYCTRRVEHIVNWNVNSELIHYSSEKFIGEGSFMLHQPNSEYRFIGRRRESARVFNKLLNKETILLRGQGGVGKTALAIHLVKRLISHNPRYHCFAFDESGIGFNAMIDALQRYLVQERGLHTIQSDVNRFARASHKLSYLLKQIKLFCDPIWVFDNMETCQQNIGGKLKEEYVEWLAFIQQDLLQQHPVIFTCRYPMAELPHVFDVALNQVSYVDYFRKVQDFELRKIKFNDVAAHLYKALGGNYRALEVFDEIYKNNKEQAVVLLQQMTVLSATITEELEAHSKRLVFSELIQLLSKEELYALILLKYFNRPVVREGVEMQSAHFNVKAALKRLHDLTLIEEQLIIKDQYYYITPLVRDWLANEQLPAIEFSHKKAGEHYEHGNRRQSESYYEDLNEALDHYISAGEVLHINSAGARLAEFYYGRLVLHKALKIALQVEAAVGVGTSESVYNTIGSIYRIFGQYRPALTYFEKSYRDRLNKGVRLDEKAALVQESSIANNMGLVYYDMGEFDKALQHWQKSANIQKDLRNHKKLSEVLLYVCDVFLRRGEINRVMELQSEARGRKIISDELAMDERQLYVHFQMARVRGDYADALDTLEKCQELHKLAGNRLGEARIMNYFATIWVDLGEYEKAIEYLTESFRIAQKLGDAVLEVSSLMNQGEMYVNQCKWSQAIEYFEVCLAKQKDIGDKAGESTTMLQLSRIYTAQKEYAQAMKALKRSRLISSSLRDKRGKALQLKQKAAIYASQRRYWRASWVLRKSLSAFEKIKDKLSIAQIYLDMAEIALERNKGGLLYKYAQKAYGIFKEFKNAKGIYRAGWLIAEFHCERRYNRDSIEMALDHLRQCEEIGRKAGFAGLPRIEHLLKENAGNNNRRVFSNY
jgi:tetratricopeptide (TPR) repeat protein